MYTDAHVHLDLYSAERLPLVLQAARRRGVGLMVTAGITWDASERGIEIAAREEGVYASVGVHPSEVTARFCREIEQHLPALAAHPRVLAISETGLDFARHPQTAELQKECFRRHVRAARELDLPLVLHGDRLNRETYLADLAILAEEGAGQVRGAVHSFTGEAAIAEAFIEANFLLSMSGLVTHPQEIDLRGVAQRAPLDWLLLDSDGPACFSPPRYGDRKSEPAFVVDVVEELARLRGESARVIEEATRSNFGTLFGV